MCKRIFLLVLVFGLILNSAAAWAAADADDLVGLISKQDGKLTRGEFAAMLVEASGMGHGESPADILVEEGILKGYPGGELDLDREITRVEVVALTARTLGLRDSILPPPGAVAPLDSNHWGYNFYAWLNRQGLVEGDGDPFGLFSEEQGAEFLSKVFSSDPELTEILAKVQSRKNSFETMRAVINAEMKAVPRQGVEGSEAVSQISELKMKIVQEMHFPDKIHQVATVTVPVPGTENKEIVSETYFVDGKMYQQVANPETGEVQWYRYPEDIFPNLNELIEQNAKQQVNVIPKELEDYLHYQLLGIRELNGEEVYAIAFYGRIDDFGKFMEAFSKQFAGMQQLQQTMGRAMDVLDSMAYWGIEYVGVDDYLTRAAEYSSFINYARELDGKAMPVETLEMKTTIEELKYNEDFSIEVPEEALAAPLLPLPNNAQQMLEEAK